MGSKEFDSVITTFEILGGKKEKKVWKNINFHTITPILYTENLNVFKKNVYHCVRFCELDVVKSSSLFTSMSKPAKQLTKA